MVSSRWLFVFLIMVSPLWAGGTAVLQKQEIVKDVWAIVGPSTNRSPENLGNNATFGLIVTSEGAVLIDSGGSHLGAKALHQVINSITDKPIKYVINTGGQDHRWFGNDYFAKQGAKIIASKAAVADQKARLNNQWARIEPLVGKDNMQGTREYYADIRFDRDHKFTLGGVQIEVCFRGHAHTPGDSFVWLPNQRAMFSGDIVYTERMLNVGSQSNSKSWVEAFEAMAVYKPAFLVPGHGKPTTLKHAQKDTYDYLRFLRQSVGKFMEDGGDVSEIAKIDQSRFAYLKNYETLKGRNAQKVYTELEWE